MRPEIVIFIEPRIDFSLLLIKTAHEIALLHEFPLKCPDKPFDVWFVVRTIWIGIVLRYLRLFELCMEALEVLRPVVVFPCAYMKNLSAKGLISLLVL